MNNDISQRTDNRTLREEAVSTSNDSDRKTLEFGVSNDGSHVVIHLGNVGKVGLPPWDAIALANSLKKHALMVTKRRMR